MASRGYLCRDCRMTFQTESLLSRHRSMTCSRRPLHEAKIVRPTVQKPEVAPPVKLKSSLTVQQKSDKQRELEDLYHHNTTQYRNDREKLSQEKKRLEERKHLLERVRSEKQEENIRKLNNIAKQQNQNALALQKIRNVTDEQGNTLKLNAEDEALLLEVFKMRQKYFDEDSKNADKLLELANVEKGIIDKANKSREEMMLKAKHEKEILEEQRQRQQQEQQQLQQQQQQQQTELSRHLERVEQDNERMRREFQRLQDLNNTFLQHQQNLMFQRDMYDRMEKNMAAQPSIPAHTRSNTQPDLDPRRQRSDLERLKVKLSDLEKILLSQQDVMSAMINQQQEKTRKPSELNYTSREVTFRDDQALTSHAGGNQVLPSDESPISNTVSPPHGFRLHFDYVRQLTRDTTRVRIVFSFYHRDLMLAGPVEIQSVNPNPHNSSLEYVFKFEDLQDVPSSTADQEFSLYIELYLATLSSPQEFLLGWNKISLYHQGAYELDLREGRWKVPMRKPPAMPNQSKAVLLANRKLLREEVFIRIVRGLPEFSDPRPSENDNTYQHLVA